MDGEATPVETKKQKTEGEHPGGKLPNEHRKVAEKVATVLQLSPMVGIELVRNILGVGVGWGGGECAAYWPDKWAGLYSISGDLKQRWDIDQMEIRQLGDYVKTTLEPGNEIQQQQHWSPLTHLLKVMFEPPRGLWENPSFDCGRH